MAGTTVKYFAYGSNMHPQRLAERVPSCELLEPASVSGYQLLFHKIGRDGSAKCNLCFTGQARDVVHGIIYRMPVEERYLLDYAEGLGQGYEHTHLDIETATDHHSVFSYVAASDYIDDSLLPFDWYRQLVLSSAIHFGFPEDYIHYIEQVAVQPDPDPERAKKFFAMLE
jgi:hypothetical protein